jgi:cytochrome c-type biogenesis protein
MAGMLTFFTPCVLPLLPIYVSFITGISISDLKSGASTHSLAQTLVRLLIFVAGFSLVFVALGASASFLGSLLWQYRDILMRVLGALIVVFGHHKTRVITIPFLDTTKRLDATRFRNSGILFPLIFGFAFGLSWSGCSTPILAPILTLAARTDTVAEGARFLFAYSLGLAVPFLASGLAFPYVMKLVSCNMRLLAAIDTVAGVLLVLFGLLLVAGKTNYLHMLGSLEQLEHASSAVSPASLSGVATACIIAPDKNVCV